MNIKKHSLNNYTVAELISDDIILRSTEDGVDLLGNLYFQGFDCIVIDQKNIVIEFFNLSSGIAGDILQKFSNYQVRLAIVGDFSSYTSSSLHAFIRGSNKGKNINFVSSIEEAIKIFSGR